jgi:hypothetical protein
MNQFTYYPNCSTLQQRCRLGVRRLTHCNATISVHSVPDLRPLIHSRHLASNNSKGAAAHPLTSCPLPQHTMAQVLVLVASIIPDPGARRGLSSLRKLELVITHAEAEDNGALTQHVVHDLLPAAHAVAAAGAGSSLLLCVAALDQPGWTVRFDNAGSSATAWSLMVPELQAAVLRAKTEGGIALDAAGALQAAPPPEDAIVSGAMRSRKRPLVSWESVLCCSWQLGMNAQT